MKKIILYVLGIGALLLVLGGFSLYREIFVLLPQENTERTTFVVKPGESVGALATRLQEEKIIRNADVFKFYLQVKKIDKNIQAGSYVVTGPLTLTKVAGELLYSAGADETQIKIIPGWDLRDIAKYFVAQGILTSSTDFFALAGIPATQNNATSTFTDHFSLLKQKPNLVSLEGYLAPETYRIYKGEKLDNILERLILQREFEFTTQMLTDIQAQGKTVHEILTLASIIEKEVKTPEDRKKVADLFWRRLDEGMGLQADSTVHYLTAREGDVFTKAQERAIDSPYNTYKYRGLPPGPISNPSVSSIMAAIYPEKNDAVYFLTDSKSNVIYSKTLDEHNQNVQKYLR